MTKRLPTQPRLSRGAWVVVLLALGWIAFGLADSLYRLQLPTDGWAFTHDSNTKCGDCSILSDNLLDLNPALKKGDVVLEVNGQPLVFSLTQSMPLKLWQKGNNLEYTVLRDGKRVRVAVTLGGWDYRALGMYLNPNSLSSLLLFLIGMFVFRIRPEHLAARVLLLITSFSFVSAFGPPWGLTEAFIPGSMYTHLLIHNFGVPLLYFPLILLLTLVFPRPKGLYKRYSALTFVTLFAATPLALALFGLEGNVGWGMGALLNLLTILSIAHTLFTVRDPEGQTQTRWLLGGFMVVGILTIPAFLEWFGIMALPTDGVINWIMDFLYPLVIPACIAVAILRYKALDINLTLSRTLVWGTLTLFVLGVYALVVGYFGSLWQSGDLGTSLLAAGLVALVFQPLRERTQRGVNRLIYGLRDEPYAVVAGLRRRLEGVLLPSEILPTITQTVAQALRLPYTAVQLAYAGGPVAVYGQPSAFIERFALTAQGEKIGELELSPREGDSFSGAERKLLEDLARHIASAARAVKLSDELQRSREALVLAREEERKRLRRDLHDGLGPTLASQTLRLDAAMDLVAHDPDAAQTMLRELKVQTQETIADIRRLVQGLRPPSLDEHGLSGALRNLAAQYVSANLSVELEIPDSLPSLPAALEVAAYRIAAEALTNVVRHAKAYGCKIRLEIKEALELFIEDDGKGLPQNYIAGVGLRSMGERARELGGTLEVIPLEKGTRIYARIPLLEA